jgi:excisionase family DNA binding protein
MSQEFYNLDEAAKKLGLTTQELNAMAQHREIRAFADRGTWRFKASDVDELATRKGLVSKPQFRIDEPEAKKPRDVMAERGPSSGGSPSGQGTGSGGSKSSPGKGDTGRVDLASIGGEGDDAPQSSSFVFGNKPVAGMTDLAGPPSPVNPNDDSVVPLGSDPSIMSPGDSRVRLDSPSGRMPDMGVHLVDFNMKPISDPPSSRKLVPPPIPPSTAKVAGSTGTGKVAQGKPDTGKAKPDTGKVKGKPDTGRIPPPSGKSGAIGSSEYDLKASEPGPSDSIFDFTAPSMPEINLDLSSQSKDAVDLAGTPMTPAQGGSMRAKLPEMGEDSSSTFELNLEPSSEEMKAHPRTPRPASTPKDTSSEFDLSLQVPKESSSDFELSLEESSGSMSALESSIPEDSSSGSRTAKIPSEEVQVGEDSDFELALDEDASSSDETGSEVVVIEDEHAPTEMGAPSKRRGGETEEAVVEPYEEEEEEEVTAPARAADWGWISLIHVPTVLILLFTGLMLFEMVRSIAGYETHSSYTGAMFNLVQSITGK